ncbi:hypothetical protein [Cupriavidus sp. D39]|uniref:hypothetical protein n=1 Tax=Cupriavidus sp. D39 TaxID=2997877 RepID=UPI00226D58D6|nr:hypothetical protein [Cupriavidus sp. D39]MCY0856870.1 hypothetical protein [Cupriavidus sp. D39]
MSTLDLQQAQQQLDQLVEAVQAGSEREVVIRDRTGRPAAKLVSLDDVHNEVNELRERLRRLERLWAHVVAASDPRAEARARLKWRVHQSMVPAIAATDAQREATAKQRDMTAAMDADAQREMAAAFYTLERTFADVLGPSLFDPNQALKEARPMFPPPHASRRRLIGIAAGQRPVPAEIDVANPEIQRMFEGTGN